MTDARERELIAAVAKLACRGEITGFRKQISDQGETITGPLQHALLAREKGLK